MIGIVIVAHGGLAQEYLSAVEHVVGHQPGMAAVSIDADHNRDAKQNEICRLADDVDTGDGVVIGTDMVGGSPSNLSLRACQPENRRIVYGANLPMLIKLAKSRDKSVPDAVRAALDAGVPLAIHSDAPVTPLGPLFTAWCAETRTTMSDRTLGPMQRITRGQALHAITMGPAYSLGLDDEIGSITPGKRADFALLDACPQTTPDLRDISVKGTVLGGTPFRI